MMVFNPNVVSRLLAVNSAVTTEIVHRVAPQQTRIFVQLVALFSCLFCFVVAQCRAVTLPMQGFRTTIPPALSPLNGEEMFRNDGQGGNVQTQNEPMALAFDDPKNKTVMWLSRWLSIEYFDSSFEYQMARKLKP